MYSDTANKIVSSSHVTFLFYLLLPLSVFSQTATSEPDTTKVTDVYLTAGGTGFPFFSMSQADFKKIVPGSQLLSGEMMKVNFNDFGSDSAGGFYVASKQTATYLNVGITLRLKNKNYKGAGPWIRFGLNYFSPSTFLNTGVFKNKTERTDGVYYINALPVNRVVTTNQELTYAFSCRSINLESTLIYKVNPSGIFSLFGGPGALLGVNYKGLATIVSTTEKTSRDYLQLSGAGYVIYNTAMEREVKKEEFNIAPNLCFGLFIDIGVDLRLGNQYAYIKNTHLFGEVKPMFRNYVVKGAGFQGSVILAGSLGLRYDLE